jgi:hypothetical protein
MAIGTNPGEGQKKSPVRISDRASRIMSDLTVSRPRPANRYGSYLLSRIVVQYHRP